MFRFFDYLYYSIHKVYGGASKDGSDASASFAIGGCQTMNIATAVLVITFLIWGKSIELLIILKSGNVVLMLLLLILNYIRYVRIPRYHWENIKKQWDGQSHQYQVRSRAFQVIYVLASFVSFIGFEIYLGSIDN